MNMKHFTIFHSPMGGLTHQFRVLGNVGKTAQYRQSLFWYILHQIGAYGGKMRKILPLYLNRLFFKNCSFCAISH